MHCPCISRAQSLCLQSGVVKLTRFTLACLRYCIVSQRALPHQLVAKRTNPLQAAKQSIACPPTHSARAVARSYLCCGAELQRCLRGIEEAVGFRFSEEFRMRSWRNINGIATTKLCRQEIFEPAEQKDDIRQLQYCTHGIELQTNSTNDEEKSEEPHLADVGSMGAATRSFPQTLAACILQKS